MMLALPLPALGAPHISPSYTVDYDNPSPTIVDTTSPSYAIEGSVESIVGPGDSPSYHGDFGVQRSTPAVVPPVVPPGGGGGGGGGGPTNPSIIINDGDAISYSRQVTLTLFATGGKEMKISNYSDFSGASWEDYDTEKAWELLPNDGLKTVYVKYKNSNGTSNTVNDAITLASMPIDITGADVNEDGKVDDYDLSILLANWYAGIDIVSGIQLDVCIVNPDRTER